MTQCPNGAAAREWLYNNVMSRQGCMHYVGYGKANNFATINLLSRHVYVQNI